MPEIAAPRSAHELIARLPRTFGPSFNDQLAQWELLFPAEQRQLQAEIAWLAQLTPEEFRGLFAPIVALEKKMDLPRWEPGAKGMSVTDTGILARSPHYPQWRTEVAKVFAKIDEGAADGLKPVARMVACVLPCAKPEGSNPLWPDLAKNGTWVSLTRPFGTGFPQLAAAVAGRKPTAGLEGVEGTWILECGAQFSPLEAAGATVLSWAGLAAARREFLNHLNTVRRDLRSVDETHNELRRIDMAKLVGPVIAASPRVREFVRSVLLSGNGSLVFPNSFVQWGASEALRRAQPQALVAAFGIRQKLKPFSSSVLFEDQDRRNPTPDEEDPAGSLVDGMMLASYVYLAAQRVAVYQQRTLTLMTACDMDRVLVLGARPAGGRMTPEDLAGFAVRWLESA